MKVDQNTCVTEKHKLEKWNSGPFVRIMSHLYTWHKYFRNKADSFSL